MQQAATVSRTNLSRFSRFIPFVLGAFIWAFVLFTLTVNCSAQSAAADVHQKEVVLRELYQPVYPAIARQARITGDVVLALNIRQDGSFESAVVISGPPLLQNAALESARQSRFECRSCNGAATPFQLVYTFQLVVLTVPCNGPEDCTRPAPDIPGPQVKQLGKHVTVVNHVLGACICDAFPRRRRSLKCLYLWRCGSR
jgi:TonB family protein